MKREQERQRAEVSLTIPDDHPVRKLFQKFRQQRDAQTPGEAAAHSQRNCVKVEAKAPGSAAAPPFTSADESEKSCRREFGERVEGQKVGGPAPGSASGGGGAAGRGAGGWARFRNAASAAPPPAAGEKEQRGEGSQPEAPEKKQEMEEMESAEAGSRTGDQGAEISAMHKTDSCDSGITVRIDRAGDSRSSFEKSPMEKSPVERNPFEQTPVTDSLQQPPIPPPSEQTLLQALLHQAKLELKGDIQTLSGRLSILEAQVSEVLRLLSTRRRLSLPPISSPRLRGKGPGVAAGPTPT